jgi:hypothetical protein
MSVKIHHGYRYTPPDGTTPDVFTLTNLLRDAITPAASTARRKAVATAASRIIDGATRHGGNASPLVAAELELVREARDADRQGLRHPRSDFGCEVTMLHDEDDNTSVYLLLYTEQAGIRDAFEHIDGVTSYGYWNNSDQPDDVSDDDWQARRDTWERILGDDTPGERGVTWTLGDLAFDAALGDHDLLVAAVPDTTTRARAILQTKALENHLRDHPGETSWTAMTQGAKVCSGDVRELARQLADITWDDLVGPP